MSFLMMILALIVMSGISILFVKALRLQMMEGMAFSAMTIVGVMYAGGLLAKFDPAVIILVILGILGFLCICFDRKLIKSFDFAYIMLIGVALFSIALYRHDFIQHIDELHQWALAVKWMLKEGKLTNSVGFIGDNHQYIGTSLFYLFFQKITGYNEAYMYVTSAILSFIGFLLPLSRVKDNRRWIFAIYIAFLYVSVYPLYRYGFKSLYVDLAPMAWTMGICLYWLMRDRQKKIVNSILAVGCMIMIFAFKIYVGLLLDLFVIMILVYDWYIAKRREWSSEKNRKIIFLCGGGLLLMAILVAAVTGIYISQKIAGGYLTWQLVQKTTMKYFFCFIFEPINGRAVISISPLWVFALAMLAQIFSKFLFNDKHKRDNALLISVSILFACGYLFALWFAYLFIFNAAESAEVFGAPRYFSIMVTMLFYFSTTRLVFMTQKKSVGRRKSGEISIQAIILSVLFVLFTFGVDERFIADSSTFCESKISSYKVIKRTRGQIGRIQNIVDKNDRVFMVNQEADLSTLSNKAQFPQNLALYYFEDRVNNCLFEPWKFVEDGCYVALQQTDLFTMEHLPEFLVNGGYSYLWVYSTDDYFSEEAARLFNYDEDIMDGSLYKIVQKEDGSLTLEYVGI